MGWSRYGGLPCLRTNEWDFVSDMCMKRWGAGVAVMENRLWVIGGMNGAERGTVPTLEVYDPGLSLSNAPCCLALLCAPLPRMPLCPRPIFCARVSSSPAPVWCAVCVHLCVCVCVCVSLPPSLPPTHPPSLSFSLSLSFPSPHTLLFILRNCFIITCT